MNKFLLILLGSFLVGNSMLARPLGVELPRYNSISLGGKIGDRVSFAVFLEMEKIDRIKTVDSVYWGRSSDEFQSVIRKFLVNVNNEVIEIPPEAYTHLLNINIPRGVQVFWEADQLVIQLSGGDGGASYVSRLFLRGSRVLRREIFRGAHNVQNKTPVDVLPF